MAVDQRSASQHSLDALVDVEALVRMCTIHDEDDFFWDSDLLVLSVSWETAKCYRRPKTVSASDLH